MNRLLVRSALIGVSTASVLVVLPLPVAATAATVLSDDFSAATVRTAADTFGVGTVASATNWIGVNGAVSTIPNGSLSLSNEALWFTPGRSGTTSGALQGLAAPFASQTLRIPGDRIKLQFNFGFEVQPEVLASGQAGAFRFGLFNDAGTQLVDNSGNQDVDDFGYRVGISVDNSPAPTGGSRLAREAGTDYNAAVGSGGAPTPPNTVNDNDYFTNPTSFIPFVGTATHTAAMSVTKTAAGADIRFTYDGERLWTISDTTGAPYLSFNEFAVVQNANAPSANGTFFIDNVSVSLTPALRGDANGDGLIDFADLGILLNRYNKFGEYANGDFNDSGFVDFADLGILLTNYNKLVSTPEFSALAAVPEPSTLLLAGIAAMTLFAAGRRR